MDSLREPYSSTALKSNFIKVVIITQISQMSVPTPLIPSHANCMYATRILRCWERQSDGIEYKKTLWRSGLRPGPRWGTYSAPQTPSWWGGGWLHAPPQDPQPRSRPLWASPLLSLTPKLVPTPLIEGVKYMGVGKFCDFRLKSLVISETVPVRPVVAMEL